MNKSKIWLVLGLMSQFRKRMIIFQRSDMTKEKQLESVEVANCGKVSIQETNQRQELVSKVCYVGFSNAISGLIKVYSGLQ